MTEVSRIPNAVGGERNSFHDAPSKQEFIDTSTWDQIIRVLEESSIQAFATEPERKLSMGMSDTDELEKVVMPEVSSTCDVTREGASEISMALRQLLADVFALYVKTKNFHWHMKGRHFRDYHLLLDEHAEQIFAMTDDIAERARKVGTTTLHSIGDISRHQRLKDNNQESVTPKNMLSELHSDNQQLTTFLRITHEICDRYHDVATASLIENWIDESERRAWFLGEIVSDQSEA